VSPVTEAVNSSVKGIGLLMAALKLTVSPLA
jgi:hypothetical protein